MSFPALLFLGQIDGSVDLIKAIGENDAFGKFTLLLLALMSLGSLTLIIQKFWVIRRAREQSRAFQRLVDNDGSWESLFMASKKYADTPLATLLKETYVECRLENWFEGKANLELEHRLQIAQATVEGVLNRTISEEETRLHGKLTTLATVSTLAPLLGLFGTVWGVLGAFQALGREGSASLSALAPGISTALVTTIFGLIAAIPAVIAYNYFMREIHKLMGAMECFSHAIENAVRKQILFKEAKPR